MVHPCRPYPTHEYSESSDSAAEAAHEEVDALAFKSPPLAPATKPAQTPYQVSVGTFVYRAHFHCRASSVAMLQ